MVEERTASLGSSGAIDTAFACNAKDPSQKEHWTKYCFGKKTRRKKK